MEEKPIQLKSYLILLALSIVWGSSFILIKKALIAFDPVELACMRISTSALAFTPIVFYHWKNIPWEKWKLFLLVGLTGTGIPAFMYFIAQTNINSTISGLLNSLTPIWTFILGILIFNAKFSKSKLAGVILGFIGAALIFFTQESVGENKNILYGLFVVVGAFCYGISGNVVKHKLEDVRSLIISSVSFFMIGTPAIGYLIYKGTFQNFQHTDQAYYSLGALLLLALVGTVLATIVFYKLIKETNAVFGSSVAYLMPIIAMGWGYLDGEALGVMIFLSIALILLGVYLIKKEG